MAEQASGRSRSPSTQLEAERAFESSVATRAQEAVTVSQECGHVLHGLPADSTMRRLITVAERELRQIHYRLTTETIVKTTAALEDAWDAIYTAQLTLAEAERRLSSHRPDRREGED